MAQDRRGTRVHHLPKRESGQQPSTEIIQQFLEQFPVLKKDYAPSNYLFTFPMDQLLGMVMYNLYSQINHPVPFAAV